MFGFFIWGIILFALIKQIIFFSIFTLNNLLLLLFLLFLGWFFDFFFFFTLLTVIVRFIVIVIIIVDLLVHLVHWLLSLVLLIDRRKHISIGLFFLCKRWLLVKCSRVWRIHLLSLSFSLILLLCLVVFFHHSLDCLCIHHIVIRLAITIVHWAEIVQLRQTSEMFFKLDRLN